MTDPRTPDDGLAELVDRLEQVTDTRSKVCGCTVTWNRSAWHWDVVTRCPAHKPVPPRGARRPLRDGQR